MRRFVIFLLTIMMIISLTGCWDINDVDNRAIIMAIGIDYADISQPPNYEGSSMIKVTLQIAIHEKLSGGAGQPATMGEESVMNISVTGQNVARAMENLLQRLKNTIFLGHIRVLVINSNVAKEGLIRHLNYFRNHPQFHRLSYLIISEGKAEDILKTFPKSANIQGIFMMQMIESGIIAGRIPDIPFGEFDILLATKGIDPIALLIDRADDNNLELIGLAVFKGDKMVGKLDIHETWTFIQLVENQTGGPEVVIDVRDESGRITINLNRVKTRMRPLFNKDGKFKLFIEMNLEGKLSAQETTTDYENPIYYQQLQNRVSLERTREVTALVTKVQGKFQADIFGFGERVRAYMPSEWKKIKDWHAKFLEAAIEVKVNTRIRRVGLSSFKKR